MILPKIRKIRAPVGIKVENLNECHPMSYTLQSWQIGEINSPKKAAMLTFLVSLMNQPVFDYLRKGNLHFLTYYNLYLSEYCSYLPKINLTKTASPNPNCISFTDLYRDAVWVRLLYNGYTITIFGPRDKATKNA